MTGGMGFGGQVGAELTDFIMVLNTSAAVKTFMHHGSITLGGNISGNKNKSVFCYYSIY
jgi:lipid-binding SYLF domain-containing protein